MLSVNKNIISDVWYLRKMYYLCTRKTKQGLLAEWLGTGLQNRLRRFESARDLEMGKSSNLN